MSRNHVEATEKRANGPISFYDAHGNLIRCTDSKAEKKLVNHLLTPAADQKQLPVNSQVFAPVAPNAHLHTTTPKVTTIHTPYTAAAAQPVPFYPPNIAETLPKWDCDKADPDNNWVITNIPESHKNKDPKSILADREMGVVFFTPKVFNELNYVVNRLADKTGECAMFICMKQLSNNEKLHARKPHFLAYDWFLPKQTASSGEVKLDVADSMRYYEYLQEKYPQEFGGDLLHRNLIHAHSHHRMNLCSWSGTDTTQQNTPDELGFQSLYKLFFLFTIGHGLKCTMVSYVPHLHKKDYAIGLCFSEPEYAVALTRARKKELDDMMDALVSKTYSVTTYSYGYGNTYTPGVHAATTPKPAAPSAYPAVRHSTPTRPADFYAPSPRSGASIYDSDADEWGAQFGYDIYAMPGATNTDDTPAADAKGIAHNEVFSLVPTHAYDTYKDSMLKMVDMLTTELEAACADSMIEIESLWENYPAAVETVETSIDTLECARNVAPINHSDSRVYAAFAALDKAIAKSQLLTVYNLFTEEAEEVGVLGVTVDDDLDHQDIIVDAITSAKLSAESLGIVIAELACLVAIGKEFSVAFLEQLYNEGYIENLYEPIDINTVKKALADDAEIGEVLFQYLD